MICVLEDDSGIRNLILYTLRSGGFEALGFETPSPFRKFLENTIPDLLLLDIMLPEEDGLSVLKFLRSTPATNKLPIIILTAKGTEYDKVAGLDGGADDYIVKPFGALELLSRVKALLRRTAAPSQDRLSVGRLTVIPSRREVLADGISIVLTLKEFEMLCLLMQYPGKVFSRDELLQKVWGFSFKGESRTVDVHIRTLRSTLGSCGEMISTIRGIGYRMGEK